MEVPSLEIKVAQKLMAREGLSFAEARLEARGLIADHERQAHPPVAEDSPRVAKRTRRKKSTEEE